MLLCEQIKKKKEAKQALVFQAESFMQFRHTSFHLIIARRFLIHVEYIQYVGDFGREHRGEVFSSITVHPRLVPAR